MVHILAGIGTADEYLTHMGDVEHADGVAYGIVLVRDVGILDRHHESRKRTHLCSKPYVLIVEAGFLEDLFHFK